MSDRLMKINRQSRKKLQKYLNKIQSAMCEADFFVEPDIDSMKIIKEIENK